MKCGTVAIIGRPNVGKSSLINALLKTHAVIISPKPQTTRNSIRCIYNDENAQIIFTDTPGINSSRDKLGIFLNDSILDAMNNSDVILWLIDAGTKKLTPDDKVLAENLPGDIPVILAANKSDKLHIMPSTCDDSVLAENLPGDIPVVLAANKSDKLHIMPSTCLRQASTTNLHEVIGTQAAPLRAFTLYEKLHDFHAKISVSALTKRGLDELINTIVNLLPDGEAIYDPEILMDTTEKFMAAEIIREKILFLLRDEVPHCVAVEIDEYKSPEEFAERSHRKLYIRASLITETEGQKKIVIGRGGDMIKKIGALSRAGIEDATGLPVYLDLWVKVLPGWRKNHTTLKRLGYSFTIPSRS